MRIWITPTGIPRSGMEVGLISFHLVKLLQALYPPSCDPFSVHQTLLVSPLSMPLDRYLARSTPNWHTTVVLVAPSQPVSAQVIIVRHPWTLINISLPPENDRHLLRPAHMLGPIYHHPARQYAFQRLQALNHGPSMVSSRIRGRASRSPARPRGPRLPGTDRRGPRGVLSTHALPSAIPMSTDGTIARVVCNFHRPVDMTGPICLHPARQYASQRL